MSNPAPAPQNPLRIARSRAWGRAALVLAGLVVALVFTEGVLGFYATTRDARLPDLTTVSGKTVLCVGDSVTFGLGIRASEAWPAQLADRLGDAGVTVHNLGIPGLRFDGLDALYRTALDALPAGAPPLVVLMLGHNDFVTAVPAPPPSGLRLARVFAWLDYTARAPLPPPPAAASPMIGDALARLDGWARERGGGLRVASYPVPGAWSGGASGLGAYVDRIRPHVLAGNALLREQARARSLGFVDVHHDAAFPESYDETLFVDSIHLSAEGAARVAAVLEPVVRADLGNLAPRRIARP